MIVAWLPLANCPSQGAAQSATVDDKTSNSAQYFSMSLSLVVLAFRNKKPLANDLAVFLINFARDT